MSYLSNVSLALYHIDFALTHINLILVTHWLTSALSQFDTVFISRTVGQKWSNKHCYVWHSSIGPTFAFQGPSWHSIGQSHGREQNVHVSFWRTHIPTDILLSILRDAAYARTMLRKTRRSDTLYSVTVRTATARLQGTRSHRQLLNYSYWFWLESHRVIRVVNRSFYGQMFMYKSQGIGINTQLHSCPLTSVRTCSVVCPAAIELLQI